MPLDSSTWSLGKIPKMKICLRKCVTVIGNFTQRLITDNLIKATASLGSNYYFFFKSVNYFSNWLTRQLGLANMWSFSLLHLLYNLLDALKECIFYFLLHHNNSNHYCCKISIYFHLLHAFTNSNFLLNFIFYISLIIFKPLYDILYVNLDQSII